MKQLAEIISFFIIASVVALVLTWLGGHVEDPGHWFPTWTGRLSLVAFILATAASLSPLVEGIQVHTATEEQRRTAIRNKAQTLDEQRRPVRERLRELALYYEQKWGWILDLGPHERRLRALQHCDEIEKWPDQDRDLRQVIASDLFQPVSVELRAATNRLLAIVDARAELFKIAVLQLDDAARADHQLRSLRAVQQFKAREAFEAGRFARRISAGEESESRESNSCCPLAALIEDRQ